jgi:hypothetical protein
MRAIDPASDTGGSDRSIVVAPVPKPPDNPDAAAQAFQQAVQKAREARSVADGNPAQQRGNEIATAAQPGDSLATIADAHNQSLSAVLTANAQFPNPNLINPGDIVFLPNPSPAEKLTYDELQQAHQADLAVAADRQPTRDPVQRKLNRADLPDAEAAAADAWYQLKSSLQDELTNAAGSTTPYPEDKVRSLVDQMRNRAPQDVRYQDVVTQAYNDTKAQWASDGRTHEKLDPLYRKTQARHEAEQEARLSHSVRSQRSTRSRWIWATRQRDSRSLTRPWVPTLRMSCRRVRSSTRFMPTCHRRSISGRALPVANN